MCCCSCVPTNFVDIYCMYAYMLLVFAFFVFSVDFVVLVSAPDGRVFLCYCSGVNSYLFIPTFTFFMYLFREQGGFSSCRAALSLPLRLGHSGPPNLSEFKNSCLGSGGADEPG